MISKLKILLILLLPLSLLGQTFTHSGTIRTEGNVAVPGVTVNLYKRTTPVITGFTNQQNYNGHSYYRSTGSAFIRLDWTNRRSNGRTMEMGYRRDLFLLILE